MADFKTALEALGAGKLDANVLAKQIDKLLQTNPKFASKMLSQLDEAHEQSKVDDSTYTSVKSQINQFRRENAGATEGGEAASGDSTVFAQGDGAAAVSDKTVKTDAPAATAAGDSTEVMSDDEKAHTGAHGTETSGVDFDISATSHASGAEATGGTGPAGTGFEAPQQGGGTELSEMFASAISLDVVDVTRKKNRIENGAPTRYTEFRKQSETTLANRVKSLFATDKSAAAGLATASIRVFPTSSVLADLCPQYCELPPCETCEVAKRALGDGKISEANRLLQSNAEEFAGHPEFLDLQRQLESRMKQANRAYEDYLSDKSVAGDRFRDLRRAKSSLSKAQNIWSDNPDYDNAESDINRLIAAAPDNPANRVMKREVVDIASVSPPDATSSTKKIVWTPAPSGRECTANLAGHGKRAKAICYDLVYTGWRGPLMVVVPGGEISDNKPFAIGKYEVSVGDWSKYCALSGKCKPETNKEKHNDPQTDITMAQAKEFTRWLSERTGKTYRIPNKAEWEYAANAGGVQPKKNWNCRLVLNGKTLKGTGIATVKFGQANGWGLKNYIGNVQEWVEDSGSTIAAGGAYSDLCTKSEISLQRPHNGSADETTGFRLILEEVG